MKKYLVKGKTHQFTVSYSDEGIVSEIIMEGITEPSIAEFFLSWVPIKVEGIEVFITHPNQKFTVVEVAQDLSFEAFWDLFAYKVGNKERTEKLWYKLSMEDRNECLRQVKKYKVWLKCNPSISHLYGETFLFQSRWKNDFTIK